MNIFRSSDEDGRVNDRTSEESPAKDEAVSERARISVSERLTERYLEYLEMAETVRVSIARGENRVASLTR